MNRLKRYETRKHSATCKKNFKNICRFKFPRPPVRNTIILHPLEEDELQDVHKENWSKIKSVLDNLCPTFTFDEYLEYLQLDEASYLLAIRSSLTNKELFYKRKPSEVRVNTYNEACLKAWRANMDIQFVLDPYACAMYMVSYITKSQRGMSNLLANAAKEASLGNNNEDNRQEKLGMLS